MEKGDSDLSRILQTHKGHLPLCTLMRYWNQMLRAVAYIHRHGVIHCDLKPANFLLFNGRLKLIDFGIASHLPVDATFIIKSFQAGTIDYVFPEALIDTSTECPGSKEIDKPQIKVTHCWKFAQDELDCFRFVIRQISTKSDVWSLGCVLHLLLYQITPLGHIKDFSLKTMTLTNPKTIFTFKELPDFYPPIFVKVNPNFTQLYTFHEECVVLFKLSRRCSSDA